MLYPKILYASIFICKPFFRKKFYLVSILNKTSYDFLNKWITRGKNSRKNYINTVKTRFRQNRFWRFLRNFKTNDSHIMLKFSIEYETLYYIILIQTFFQQVSVKFWLLIAIIDVEVLKFKRINFWCKGLKIFTLLQQLKKINLENH